MNVECQRSQYETFDMEHSIKRIWLYVENKARKMNVNAGALSRNTVVMTNDIKREVKEIFNRDARIKIGGHQGVQGTYERLK